MFLKNDPDLRVSVEKLVRGYMYENGMVVGEVVQATADYPALARIGAYSSVAALALTLALLVAFGPIASLGGVLAGEVVITLMLFPLTRVWRKRA